MIFKVLPKWDHSQGKGLLRTQILSLQVAKQSPHLGAWVSSGKNWTVAGETGGGNTDCAPGRLRGRRWCVLRVGEDSGPGAPELLGRAGGALELRLRAMPIIWGRGH